MALENKYQGKVKFVIANVDTTQGQELAQKFKVNSIPAFFFLDKNKNIVQQGVGETPLAEMERMMETIIP